MLLILRAKNLRNCNRKSHLCYKHLALLAIFLFGCSYHWTSHDDERTISVPNIIGDTDGLFTTELIHQCSISNSLSVVSTGRYRLDVKIVKDSVDALGFRRDPQKIDGKIHKHLIQNEERRTVLVDVSLFDQQNQQIVFGPLGLSADVDYDYVDGDSLQDLQFQNAAGERFTVLPFSLGQLESQEAAHEVAQRPLYQKLSQKIVGLITRWLW
jgi:hypothetical protein